jgi:hypothetical protein
MAALSSLKASFRIRKIFVRIRNRLCKCPDILAIEITFSENKFVGIGEE